MWPEPSPSLAISCSSRSARPRKRPDGSLPWLTSNCRKTINRSAPRPSPTACARTSCGKRAPCSSQGQACEGRYLLRTNLSGKDPALLWRLYIQLTEIEQAFKELKGDLAIRPIYHQHDHRIEAHIFVAFVAYCLQVTLKQRLRALAPGLTPRARFWKNSRPCRWSTCTCRRPTAATSCFRDTPNPTRISNFCCNSSS